jgi:16S rRNA (guanine966-N2)-methyltransferase
VRVIAGTARGHLLKSLKGLETRPTLDRVREAVFNTIAPKVPGAKFLDLFAGTGAIGIEALSRGAAYCCFNDHNMKVCRVIKENLQKCKLDRWGQVYHMNGLQLLHFLAQKDPVQFDLVYLDPPYHFQDYAVYLQKLEDLGLLAQNSMVIAESSKELSLDERYQGLVLWKKSRYGDTLVWYYNLLGEE